MLIKKHLYYFGIKYETTHNKLQIWSIKFHVNIFRYVISFIVNVFINIFKSYGISLSIQNMKNYTSGIIFEKIWDNNLILNEFNNFCYIWCYYILF